MNPPFGGRNGLVPWLRKFVEHSNGIALVPDRTSAPWWQEFDPQMDLTFFVAKKIKFIDGRTMDRGKSPAQGTTLWSIGSQGASALRHAEASGFGVLHTAATVDAGVNHGFKKQEMEARKQIAHAYHSRIKNGTCTNCGKKKSDHR